MSQKPIREVQAKNLISDHWSGPGKPSLRFAPIGPETDIDLLPKKFPWLTEGEKDKKMNKTVKKNTLVVKVDELFGKRGKLGYVHMCKNFSDAKRWIEKFRGKEVTIGARKGVLHHFLIEPFIEHKKEYYCAFTCERECDVILSSEHGGIDVEDQKNMQKIEVAFDQKPDLSPIPKVLRPTVSGLFTLFRSLDLGFLEINPLTIVGKNSYLLDAVCRIDTCAAFRQRSTWGFMEIPEGFGATPTTQERAIHALDQKSGSSLKFILLNPKGRIWTMVAGGGASIIYADAITALVPPEELANYGEWSGNPTTDEMEQYTKNILELMTVCPSSHKALLIGGGIANFTDIAKTFAGIIKALHSLREKLQNVKIYVRRAGPRDREGLEKLQKACDSMGIACVTHGAELPMTEIVGMALSHITNSKKDSLSKSQLIRTT